jgi:hypothetical protein
MDINSSNLTNADITVLNEQFIFYFQAELYFEPIWIFKKKFILHSVTTQYS